MFILSLLLNGITATTDTKQGDVKAVVHMTQNPTSGRSYFTADGFKVDLYGKDSSVLASQYVYGVGGTLDFGTFDYGAFTLKVNAGVYYNNNGYGYVHDHDISQSQNFSLDAPTKTITFVVQ